MQIYAVVADSHHPDSANRGMEFPQGRTWGMPPGIAPSRPWRASLAA
jgi:hypothetical protein